MKSLRTICLIACAASLSGCSLLPDFGGRGADRPSDINSGNSQSAARSADERQCLNELEQSGARFSPLADRNYGGGCGLVNSVTISALRGDSRSFALANLGPVACPLATGFAGWARFGVDRAARQLLGSGLERIETMGSYSCRNVAGSSRRSAHSRAEAIDVSAFVLRDGRRIVLERDWNGSNAQTRAFLRAVHQSACKRFGTVLGPDYNAAHRDHFHFELSKSGSTTNFCR